METHGGRHQPQNRFSAVRHGDARNREWAIDDKLLGGYFGEFPVSYERAMARAEYLNGPEGQAALAAQASPLRDLLATFPLPWVAGEVNGLPVVLSEGNVVMILPDNATTPAASAETA